MSVVSERPSNFFNLANSIILDIIDLPLSPICVFKYAVSFAMKRLNLKELFLVSLKELLVLFLDLL